jgi:hypothetical protein
MTLIKPDSRFFRSVTLISQPDIEFTGGTTCSAMVKPTMVAAVRADAATAVVTLRLRLLDDDPTATPT